MRRTAKLPHSRIPLPGKPGTCRLRVEELGVTLDGESILHDVTFQLNCREIVALIGPNGAGKSSLFRTILGQLPYTGTIRFELAGGRPSRPKIGYVPQSPSFDRGYPISVLDFFAAAISRWPVFLPVPERLRARVAECLGRGPSAHADRDPLRRRAAARPPGPGAGADPADPDPRRAALRCGRRRGASAHGDARRDPPAV